eukprot:818574-Amphidinium_carterae.1
MRYALTLCLANCDRLGPVKRGTFVLVTCIGHPRGECGSNSLGLEGLDNGNLCASRRSDKISDGYNKVSEKPEQWTCVVAKLGDGGGGRLALILRPMVCTCKHT